MTPTRPSKGGRAKIRSSLTAGKTNLYVYVGNDPITGMDPLGLGPVEIAACLASHSSISECLNSERQLACRNWGIFCDDDQPSPAAPIFPPRPANDNGDDGPYLRDCKGNLYNCLGNKRQPPDRCEEFGPEKDCGACYRACNQERLPLCLSTNAPLDNRPSWQLRDHREVSELQIAM